MPLNYKPVSLGTQSNAARFGQAGAARLINCFAEEIGPEGKIPFILTACDGLYEFATLVWASGAVRAGIVVNGVLYVVAGRQLFRVNASGEYSILGGIATDGPVTMARNRAATPEIGIVSDGLYWVCSGDVLTQISDPDLSAPYSIAVLDGYFILPGLSGRWSITGIDDATSISALDFTTAASSPDEVRRVFTREREAVFLGEETIEWWTNTGAAAFPFERQQAIEVGCKAAGSVARLDRTMCWVADDNTVRIMEGYGARRISTHQVERDIDSEADPTLIEATSWYDRGHQFYAVHTANTTHVYDLTTGQWHERQSTVSGANTRWRGSQVFRLGEKLIVGDYAEGKLYEMRPDMYDEDGDPLRMIVRTPPVHVSPYRMRYNGFAIDALTGVGVVSGDSQDMNPELMLRYSDDGGHSWSTERRKALGTTGQKIRKCEFLRLGASKAGSAGRTFEISCSAKVARGLMGAAVAADQLGA